MPKSLSLQKELANYISDALREVDATKPSKQEILKITVIHVLGNLRDDNSAGETRFLPDPVFQPAQRGTGFKLGLSSFTPAPPHTQNQLTSHEEESSS